MKSLEDVVNELFIILKATYNKGDKGIKGLILTRCMLLVCESLENDSDRKKLKEVYSNITGVI